MAVAMPTRFPLLSSKGPPLFPGLIAASVCKEVRGERGGGNVRRRRGGRGGDAGGTREGERSGVGANPGVPFGQGHVSSFPPMIHLNDASNGSPVDPRGHLPSDGADEAAGERVVEPEGVPDAVDALPNQQVPGRAALERMNQVL